MKTLSILSTKLSAWGLHLIGRGGSMPGSIGCKVDANILSKLKFNGPVILVTGTNGKTKKCEPGCAAVALFDIDRRFGSSTGGGMVDNAHAADERGFCAARPHAE